MKLLHNLCQWARKNKLEIQCFLAIIAAFAVLITFLVVIGGRNDTLAEEPTTEEPAAQEVLPEPEHLEEPSTIWVPDQEEVEAIARTLYAECRGVESVAERAAVAWCILNRVDDPSYPDTVLGVVEQPYQFAYDETAPLWPFLERLAADVLTRYHREKSGETDVGRTLPAEYLYFEGDGERNWFTTEWQGKDYWDWSLPDPYAGEDSYGLL